MADARLKAYGAAMLVALLDRLTKWIVESRVGFFDTYKVIPGFFDIVHSQNRGAAFGLFNDSTSEWKTLLLGVIALGAVAGLAAMLWRPQKLDRLSLWGFTLILGGAAGNVYDRLVLGRVTDFLELYIADWHWPTFNVADSAITIGSGLLIIEMLRPKRQAAGA
jgi:signal peptidase II